MTRNRPRESRRPSLETWVGIESLGLATAAMAVDHLFGNDPEQDDSFPVDPDAFLISVGISALVAAFRRDRVALGAGAYTADAVAGD